MKALGKELWFAGACWLGSILLEFYDLHGTAFNLLTLAVGGLLLAVARYRLEPRP